VNGTSQGNGGAASVLDMQVIEGLRELGGEDDPGLLLEIIGMFLEDAPARIREIELGLANGDIKLLERAAHSLKSASANVGAMRLSSVCRRIEEIARQAKSEGIAELIPESNLALNDAATALRSLRG
jgi:HPt (histidine-containing phosphotransfer) domain-containing protein